MGATRRAGRRVLRDRVRGGGADGLRAVGARVGGVPQKPVVVDHALYPQALATSVAYLGKYTGRVTPEAVAEASEVIPAVAACLSMSGSQDLTDKAIVRLAELRRLLGIAPPCLTSAECPTGLTCNPRSGACRRACTQSRDCDAGDVCHKSVNACARPCTSLCPGGGACVAGICQVGAESQIGGGRGWGTLATCGRDTACLQVLDSPARDALRRMSR